MADLPAPSFEDVPKINPQAGQQQVPGPPAGIGYAPKGVQIADAFVQTLQGLRQGYINNQMKKFNNIQDSASIAKSQYDAQNVLLDQYAKAVAAGQMDPNDPRITAAKQAAAQSKAVMDERRQQLQDLFGKPGKAKPGQEGQETAHSKLGKALTQAFDTVRDATGRIIHPNPFSTPPLSTPQFNPNSPGPVPAPPAPMGIDRGSSGVS